MYYGPEHIVYDDSTPSEYEGDDSSKHSEGGDDDEHTRYVSRRYLCKIDTKQRLNLLYYLTRKDCDTHNVNLCDVTVYEERGTYTILRRTIGAPLYDDAGNYADDAMIDDYLPVRWHNLTAHEAYEKCLLLQTLFYKVPIGTILQLQRAIRKKLRRGKLDGKN